MRYPAGSTLVLALALAAGWGDSGRDAGAGSDTTAAAAAGAVFADGFAGERRQPGSATHRPAGLAVSPDGALYITDDQRGTVWRVVYGGEAVAGR
jgi:glucose/arabinose dehydrogenase